MKTAPSTGLYVSAEAIAKTPDYAKVLVEEHGVDLFVLRTGFDPSRPSPDLDDAMEVTTRLGVDTMFLVGAWWGAGITDPPRALVPVQTVCEYDAGQAHESQWEMLPPEQATSQPVRETIARLCERYDPAGICLTHARFKHAADINSLFGVSDGEFGRAMCEEGIGPRDLAAGLDTVSERLRVMPLDDIRRCASGKTMVEFLDALTDGDLFSRWFAFRCRWVVESLKWIFAPTRQSHPEMRLGTNAVGPLFSDLSGQDYRRLGLACDFVQPLLGYMRWHVLQPIYMWARFFRQLAETLDLSTAVSLSAGLFGLAAEEFALDWNDRDEAGEGDEMAIINMVRRQLSMLPTSPDTQFMPVLRGHGLSRQTMTALTRLTREFGNPSLIYQGSQYIGGVPPHDGWQ